MADQLKPGMYVTTLEGQFAQVTYVKEHNGVTYVGLSNGQVKPASQLKKVQ